jgi:hypothetical protein
MCIRKLHAALLYKTHEGHEEGIDIGAEYYNLCFVWVIMFILNPCFDDNGNKF